MQFLHLGQGLVHPEEDPHLVLRMILLLKMNEIGGLVYSGNLCFSLPSVESLCDVLVGYGYPVVLIAS